ncbi:hypothetical protein VTK73DRAFT_10344 [Phialemonium thermophilum]|uniref:Uncharacterized protein n=1 Tax=Phialemonium thermophilum TaxID=223376 RepID=A0ABR3VXG1_9PEZI
MLLSLLQPPMVSDRYKAASANEPIEAQVVKSLGKLGGSEWKSVSHSKLLEWVKGTERDTCRRASIRTATRRRKSKKRRRETRGPETETPS